MILSDVDIEAAVSAGRLRFDPSPPDEAFGPASVDLRLAGEFRTYRRPPALGPWRRLGEAAIDLALAPFGGRSAPAEAAWPVADPSRHMDLHVVPEGGAFLLQPGCMALGVTIERVTIPADLLGKLDGRSSLARYGLQVHLTAHTIHAGWDGRIVLEFLNGGSRPFALRGGDRVCAIEFHQMSTPARRPYGARTDAKYAGQAGVAVSRFAGERVYGDRIRKTA